MLSRLVCILLLPAILLNGLSSTSAQEWTSLESGVKYQLIGTWDPAKFEKIVTSELAEFMDGSPLKAEYYSGKFAAPKHSMRLYKVSYPSVIPELNNQPTVATGVIAVPVDVTGPRPVISYQHGTIFGRYDCPSSPDNSMEYKLMLAQFGSPGYIVVSADYFGIGDDQKPNSYLMRESTEQACLDMLKATRQVLASLKVQSGPLFLNGWSQGGYSTLTFLRRLEKEGVKVTAASLASAGGNILVMGDRWMNNPQPGDAVYLTACVSNLLYAAETYWHIPGLIEEAIRPEYREVTKQFFDFKISYPEFASKTPKIAKDLLRPEFLAGGQFAQHPFWKALDANEAYQWRCVTPLRIYYGDVDEVIPQAVATTTALNHQLLSGKTEAILNGPQADHRGNYVLSLFKIKPWFDEFLK